MKKIAALHKFIVELDLFAAEQMESDVDDLVITPNSYPTDTVGQIVIADQDYTATFFIERYPHGQVSSDVLIAQISAWLLAYDTGRTDPLTFSVIVDVLDTETANLEFGIKFNEKIIVKEDINGALTVNSKKYALL